MKGSDFLGKINETTGVTIAPDVLAKLGEIELPDELQKKFSEIFISRERAKNDQDIIDHVVKDDRRKIFDNFDQKILTLFPFIGPEHQNLIKNERQTYQKYDFLPAAIQDFVKTQKGKVSEDIQKVEDEWAKKLKERDDAHKKQLDEQQNKFKETQFEYVVNSKLLGYQFADPFLPVRDQLIKTAIYDLKAKPFLYELENGTVAIRQEKDGVKRDVFEEGTETKLTLEKMLDKFIGPFIKKNNGEGNKPEPTSSTRTTTQPPVNPAGMTHRERMAASVNGH